MTDDVAKEISALQWRRLWAATKAGAYIVVSLLPVLAVTMLFEGSEWPVYVLGAAVLTWPLCAIWAFWQDLLLRALMGDIEQRVANAAPCSGCGMEAIPIGPEGKIFSYACSGCGNSWTQEVATASVLTFSDM